MVFALLGKSGSGKSTILKKVIESFPELKLVIPDTTRPLRSGEINHKDYNFISEEDFLANAERGEYLLPTKYGRWFYGTKFHKYPLEEDYKQHNYILVTNPQEYLEMVRLFKRKLIGFLIEMQDKQRILNYLNREENVDCHEMCRRFIADEVDFSYLNLTGQRVEKVGDSYLTTIFNNYGYVDNTVNEVVKIIKSNLI